MYSVILMAALTANTAEAPAFHWKKSLGCQGGLYLHGAGYGSCMGCWGAAWGCGGCYGGGASYGGCYGCMGCYGSYSAGGGSCNGCYGGWYGYGATYDGGMTYPGTNPMSAPAAPPPATGTPPATPPAGTPPATPGTPPATGRPAGTSAKLIIEKPADAKIYVDERLVSSEGTRQTFATPSLDPTQAYFYMVRVEAVRDGKPVSESRRVIVRAGETVSETFATAGIETASLKAAK
jgi:uncharacterized protein (TIGR03000 family)